MTPLRQRMIEDMRTAGLAPGTQALYLDAVRHLAAHYHRSPDELSEEEVRAYLLGLRERGVALGTFKTNHGGIQFLYRWTLDRDWPLFGKKRIRPPKQRRLPSALPDPEIRALLGCVRNPGHKTCLSVMYACGLRISEAATLEVGAIDSANMLLRVTGKGNKQRLVPLPRPLLNDLRDLWRTHRHPRWLFLNRDGTGPANTPALGFTFRNARAAAGIKQKVPPHVLRHYVSSLTMWGKAARSAILPVNHSVLRVEASPTTRHSPFDFVDR